MSLHIIGMGMGNAGTLTGDAREAIEQAELLIGAERLLHALPDQYKAERYTRVNTDEIANLIANHSEKKTCVLMSGDTGFYSGTKSLLERIDVSDATIHPGISSLQFFAARLKRPWHDWKLVSAHGKEIDAINVVQENGETFFLTGGVMTVRCVCHQLAEAGFGALRATVGENLGNDRERINVNTVENISLSEYDDLSVLLIDNPQPMRLVSCGFPDDAFIRGKTPMTKSEVRSVILSKLRLHDADIVYDVGAGTGSISVEAALLAKHGHVFAFEREPEGCRLIRENAVKFSVDNITVIEGDAPESFSGIPIPAVAFIGGSHGNLKKIVNTLLELNPHIRIVISALALETLSETTGLLSSSLVSCTEIVQISVSRAKLMGGYHLMTAQNPIFIVSTVGCPDVADTSL